MDGSLYECAECHQPVTMVDGNPVRSCEHDGATILANMEAVVRGESGIQ